MSSHELFDDSFGGKLKALRWRVEKLRNSRFTQYDLAKLVGVTQPTIESWENDKRKIKINHLQKIIEIYLDLGAFVNIEEEIKELWVLSGIAAALDRYWLDGILKNTAHTTEEKDKAGEPTGDAAFSTTSDFNKETEMPEQSLITPSQTPKYKFSRRSLVIGCVGFIAGSAVGGIVASSITYSILAHETKWATTGNMLQGRHYFRATTLKNGMILVEGGSISAADNTAESELFDPTIGMWKKTRGKLNEQRSQHTATHLLNGKVLVTGGFAAVTRVSAEIYDPVTDTWNLTKQSMSTARVRHTGTLLQNGKVLIAGGVNHSTAELYDPDTDTWSQAGIMSIPRSDHIAVRLLDGTVLVAGGTFINDGQSITKTAEIYDPNKNRWTSVSDMNIERAYFTAHLLPNGNVLVIGGRVHGFKSTSTVEVYDRVNQTWSFTDHMLNARQNALGQEALLLENGMIMVCGGDSLGTSEIYSPTTQSWVSWNRMYSPHIDGVTALIGHGQVLTVGGTDANNQIVGMAERYLP